MSATMVSGQFRFSYGATAPTKSTRWSRCGLAPFRSNSRHGFRGQCHHNGRRNRRAFQHLAACAHRRPTRPGHRARARPFQPRSSRQATDQYNPGMGRRRRDRRRHHARRHLHRRRVHQAIYARGGRTAFNVAFEREADYVGAYYAARAGYDLAGAEEFWRALSLENPDNLAHRDRSLRSHRCVSFKCRRLPPKSPTSNVARLPLDPELKAIQAETVCPDIRDHNIR